MKEDLAGLPENLIRGGFQSQFSSEGRYERLTPQEREKALEVAREVVAEAKTLLGVRYSTTLTLDNMSDPKGGMSLTILGNQPEEELTRLDSELTISTFQLKDIGLDTEFALRHLYGFNIDRNNPSISYTRTQFRKSNVQIKIVREANAEDLNALLQNLRASRPKNT